MTLFNQRQRQFDRFFLETPVIAPIITPVKDFKMINRYEYTYLKGNKKVWLDQGAAYNAVAEFCKAKGYGEFGLPTELGLEVMKEFELNKSG